MTTPQTDLAALAKALEDAIVERETYVHGEEWDVADMGVQKARDAFTSALAAQQAHIATPGTPAAGVWVPKRPTVHMLLAMDGWTDLFDGATEGASESRDWKDKKRLMELALAWEVGWMTACGIDIDTVEKSYLDGLEDEIDCALIAAKP